MENGTERFSIKISDKGIIIISTEKDQEKSLSFTASEALMLLDILKNEEKKLHEMAQKESPLHFRMTFNGNDD